MTQKPIPDTDGYFIDAEGNITNKNGKRISSRPDSDGYRIVTLRKCNKPITCKVHQLVLLAFVGPRPTGMETNHINLNRSDNRLENLEYITHKQNLIHAHANGRIKMPRGDRSGACKISDATVLLIREDILNGFTYRQIMNKYGISMGAVHYAKYHR